MIRVSSTFPEKISVWKQPPLNKRIEIYKISSSETIPFDYIGKDNWKGENK